MNLREIFYYLRCRFFVTRHELKWEDGQTVPSSTQTWFFKELTSDDFIVWTTEIQDSPTFKFFEARRMVKALRRNYDKRASDIGMVDVAQMNFLNSIYGKNENLRSVR